MVDWIAWPVIAFVPLLLAYDTAFMEWLHIPNGYLCTMAVFGAIHTFVLLVAGCVFICLKLNDWLFDVAVWF